MGAFQRLITDECWMSAPDFQPCVLPSDTRRKDDDVLMAVQTWEHSSRQQRLDPGPCRRCTVAEGSGSHVLDRDSRFIAQQVYLQTTERVAWKDADVILH